jgi:hypothetical protein
LSTVDPYTITAPELTVKATESFANGTDAEERSAVDRPRSRALDHDIRRELRSGVDQPDLRIEDHRVPVRLHARREDLAEEIEAGNDVDARGGGRGGGTRGTRAHSRCASCTR